VAAQDIVVLGISLGAIPYVAKDIVATSPRWQAMVEHVRTVPTEALQLWLERPTAELGWQADATVGGYGQPFDTWSDMPASLIAESHDPTGPRGLAYFCSAFNTAGQSIDPTHRGDVDLAKHFHKAWNAADERLRHHVDEFVRRRLPLLWGLEHPRNGNSYNHRWGSHLRRIPDGPHSMSRSTATSGSTSTRQIAMSCLSLAVVGTGCAQTPADSTTCSWRVIGPNAR
jgi:hypothetical protein